MYGICDLSGWSHPVSLVSHFRDFPEGSDSSSPPHLIPPIPRSSVFSASNISSSYCLLWPPISSYFSPSQLRSCHLSGWKMFVALSLAIRPASFQLMTKRYKSSQISLNSLPQPQVHARIWGPYTRPSSKVNVLDSVGLQFELDVPHHFPPPWLWILVWQ